MDEQYYVPASREPNVVYMGGRDRSFTLGIDDYLEVVDVYVVTLLGSLLNDMEHAFSWVEKAELPEEKRKVKHLVSCLYFGIGLLLQLMKMVYFVSIISDTELLI